AAPLRERERELALPERLRGGLGRLVGRRRLGGGLLLLLLLAAAAERELLLPERDRLPGARRDLGLGLRVRGRGCRGGRLGATAERELLLPEGNLGGGDGSGLGVRLGVRLRAAAQRQLFLPE